MANVPRAPFWAPRPADDTYWSGSPVKSPIIPFLTAQKVFGAGGQVSTKRWLPNYTIDDPPVWSGSPLDAAPLRILTQQKLFGQGGQAVPFRPNFTIDEPPMWQGAPVDSPIVSFLTKQKVYGAGGQVPPYRWNFTADDPPAWQLLAGRNSNLFATSQNPFSNRQTSWYSEDSNWQGAPAGSAPLRILTSRRLFGQGGQVPPSRWNFNNDDPPPWSRATVRNANLLQSQNPFSNRQWQWSDDASGWTGQPIASAIIPQLTKVKFFGAGGQTPPFRPNFTLDDAPSWWPATERNLILLTTPIASPRNVRFWLFNYDVDAPQWQGGPSSDYLLFQPQPPPVLSFNLRVFGYSGILQMPILNPQQDSEDSLYMLYQPYEFGILAASNQGIPVTVGPSGLPLYQDYSQILRIEVPDGQAIRYEVNPAGRSVLASASSPILTGVLYVEWGPGWSLSFIDASTAP